MRIIIALAIILTAGVANAAPVFLSCSGDWRALDDGQLVGDDHFSIIVDPSKGALRYKSNMPLSRFAKDDAGESFILPDDVLVITIRLDRVAGTIKVHEQAVDRPAKSKEFLGTCKPAK